MYTLQYVELMDCFIAVPDDDTADCVTLPGSTETEARAFAERTDVWLR